MKFQLILYAFVQKLKDLAVYIYAEEAASQLIGKKQLTFHKESCISHCDNYWGMVGLITTIHMALV